MANTFASILDRDATTIERPKPLPVGTYHCVLNGMPRFDKSTKKQTDFVEFDARVMAAGDDVDQEELQEWLTNPDGTKKELGQTSIKIVHYITENAVWRLKEFLSHCGFDVDQTGVSLRQMIEQSAGSQVMVQIIHEASQDGQSFFAKPGQTSAAA